MSGPLLTIGIPSLDRGKMALRAVESILSSKLTEEQIEVVLLNNASNRQTDQYDLIKNLKDTRLRYHRRKEVQNVSYQFLELLEMAQGKYLMFMSDEDLLDEEKMQELLISLKYNYKVISCGFPGVKYTRPFLGYLSNAVFCVSFLTEIQASGFMRAHMHNYAVSIYPHIVMSFFSDLYSCVNEKANKAFMPIICVDSDEESYQSDNRKKVNDHTFHKYYSAENRFKLLCAWLELFEMFFIQVKENETGFGSLEENVKRLYLSFTDGVLWGIILTEQNEIDAEQYLKKGLEALNLFVMNTSLQSNLYLRVADELWKSHRDFIETYNICSTTLDNYRSELKAPIRILYGCLNYASAWIDRFFEQGSCPFDAYFDGKSGLTKNFLLSRCSSRLYPLQPEWLADLEGKIDVVITAKTECTVLQIINDIQKYNSNCNFITPFIKKAEDEME